MKKSILDIILRARTEKVPLAIITRIKDGMQCTFLQEVLQGDLELSEPNISTIKSCIKNDKSSLIADDEFFVHIYNPPLRLIIIGAVHIAQALAPMARMTGFDVTVVDPRASFATSSRFPGITLCADWPDDALEKLNPDSRTAVVTLTHDPKLDDPALMVALKTPVFYIASLGGKRTHGKRLERLKNAGFETEDINRINGPAGLDIGAVSPSEIAVSILAELTAILHRHISFVQTP
jgi:xanthine dehydrogenase accessory factor